VAALKILCSISASGTRTLVRHKSGWQPGEAPARQRRSVITNLIDESYVAVDLPKLRGADRRSFIDLQLQQRFAETPLRAVLPFKATANKDRIVLTGMGNSQAEEEIRAMAEAGVEIMGVWSLPTLLMDALGDHARKLPRALLASLPTPDGLRLLFVLDGQPTLTRLLPASLSAEQENQEIITTRRYLEDSRTIERGSPLALLALDAPAGQVEALARVGFKPIAPPWGVPRQGTQLDRLLDMSLHAAPGQLAPNTLRERFRVRKMRTLLVAATAGCVGLAALAGVHSAQGTVSTWQRMDQIRKGTQEQRALIAQHNQALESKGVDAELLRVARRLGAEELAPSELPTQALQRVAETLSTRPDLQLERLVWRRTLPAQACTKGGAGGAAEAPAMGAAAPDPLLAATAAAAPAPGSANAPAAVASAGLEVRLDLRVPKTDSPVAAAQQRLQLANAMRAWPNTQLLRGGDLTDNVPVLRGGGNGAEGAGNTDTIEFCLAMSEPAQKLP
jgi:hypothetical protein